MIGATGNGLGAGNGWGHIRKTVETLAQAAMPPAPSTTPESPQPTTATVVEPAVSTQPSPLAQTVNSPVSVVAPTTSDPLTYSAPSSGQRQISATVDAPVATLGDRLADSGYYASPQAASVADPVASAQREKDGAALTQAQVIAQAAYNIVARAGADDRLSLIRDG